MSPEETGFLYPFIEADEHDADALLRDLGGFRLRQGGREQPPRNGHARGARRGDRRGCARHGGAVPSRRTAVHLRQRGKLDRRRRLGGVVREAPSGRALPARSLVADQAVLTALGNDVGFDLTFSRQLIAFAAGDDIAIGYSTSGNSENVIRGLRGGQAPPPADHRLRRLRGGPDGSLRCAGSLLCRTVAQRAPDPGDAGRPQLPPLGGRAGPSGGSARPVRHGTDDSRRGRHLTERGPGRGRPRSGTVTTDQATAPSGREAAVLERIETFRRRRPRFRDDMSRWPTGAGGKASAALIDAVFLDAFSGLERPPLTDAALIELPSGEHDSRSRPTRSS